MMRKLSLLLLPLLSALLIVSAVMVFEEVRSRQKENNLHEELLRLVEIPEQSTAPESLPQEEEVFAPEDSEAPEPAVHERNLSPLFGRNPECVGWICIEGTNIDYPVMHTPDDPQKYLRLNFDGEYSQSGVPFLDARCDPNRGTLLVYGHNMKNGTQFADLKKYLDTGFRNAHPNIAFETEAGIRFFTVVNVLRTDIYDEKYNEIAADDDTLMLSTCYGSAKSGRLLIIAKEANP